MRISLVRVKCPLILLVSREIAQFVDLVILRS
jgi:hypothetical protein